MFTHRRAPPPPKQPKTRNFKPSRKKDNIPAEPLPFWTFIVAAGVLLGLIALLSWLITN